MRYRWLLYVFLGGLRASAQDDLDLNSRLGRVDVAHMYQEADHYVWCTSVIKGKDGRYHMLYSRWPHGERLLVGDSMNYIFNGFRGWNKYSEIAYAVSDQIGGPYRSIKTILKGDGDTSRWDRFTMHNPQIRKFGKYYYLYYISNSFDSTLYKDDPAFSTEWLHWLRYNSTQKIGVLKFKKFEDIVKGTYQRSLLPLMQPDSVHTFEVTNNPTVTRGPNGKYYMMFKSRKPHVGNMTFWMAISDQPDGPYTLAGEVFTREEMACEDPCIWYDKKRKRFYAAAKYYSDKKILAPQHGALVLLTSGDGLNWSPAQHPLISLRELTFTDGRKIALSHLERPFVMVNKHGQVSGIFAAASIDEPSKKEVNTFSVYIPVVSIR